MGQIFGRESVRGVKVDDHDKKYLNLLEMENKEINLKVYINKHNIKLEIKIIS